MSEYVYLENDCKKYLGLPPYDDFGINVCYKDIYFIQSLYEKYGKDNVLKCLNELYSRVGADI
jgi:hypothetical protein